MASTGTARLADALGDIRSNTRAALEAVLEAWADACRETAPQYRGVLAESISYGFESDTRGYLTFVWYGEYQAVGIPGGSARGWSGRTYSMPPLSQSNRAIRQRARYAARVGRSVQHPNEWYQRAWEDERVQEAVRRFPALMLTPGG